ncbi:hypothetical protein A2801_02290 [Candidatus Woesebacteria bacterium RIFCSPHIGHO2_01_FULL_41_10]|uniref:Uncharacterized protein n=1 Tax=Candidatus Woesebacteria bacterium RIFCSPHIGHO2_01_FULL_41_10 TaxID=1802500 RepID=A0A1F7YPZ8_9BACT|nr:MAG: hypothetical protein A2801_02290 [Candidatus Woesebacteria bacterium RIFCSPHIGHO2_01_FULL_41_10]
MAKGNLNITLRPIKIAFLVDISDTKAILEAISINSILWGGIYNPVIPVFDRKPKILSQDVLFKHEKNDSILKGYINAFDPDFVVQLGKIAVQNLDIGGRERITPNDILSGLKKEGTVGYGVGIFEILNHFYEKELKFERKNPPNVVKPRLPKRGRLFFSSIFGELPKEIDEIVTDNYTKPFNIKTPICSLNNYHELLTKDKLFVRRFTGMYIDAIRRSHFDRDILYFMDANSNVDIIDFWNLRALGLRVVPIAKQVSNTEGIKKFASQFIDYSFGQSRFNPQIYYTATIQKGRSVLEKDLQDFLKFLDIKPDSASGQPKISVRYWYPRIWDEWARDKDGAGGCDLQADTLQKDLLDTDNNADFKVLPPKFINEFGVPGTPRFANEVELKMYSDKNVIAEVMPQGDQHLANKIGGYGINEWRLSKNGLVYLSDYVDWTVRLPLPEAETVFLSWIESMGWKAKISAAGQVGKQLIKHMGGLGGIGTIANEEIINLLGKLTGQNRILSSLLTKVGKLEKTLKSSGNTTDAQLLSEFMEDVEDAKNAAELKEGPILHEKLLAEISKATSNAKFPKDPKRYLKRLIDINMFKIGVKVQCPICQKHSWYSLKELDYEMECPKCIEKFAPPMHSPKDEMQWSYRPFGPFSLPNLASGSYSVLITLRFFSELLRGAVTPSMSFTLEKDNTKPQEVDLGLIFSWSKFGNSEVVPIFAECKSFWDKFDETGISNLEILGQQIPGSLLVFSTFRRKLEKEELDLLKALVARNRKNRKARKPYNQILILTGTELFSEDGPPECWESGTDEHKKIAKLYDRYQGIDRLCDVTQQMYLGFKPWDDEIREFYEAKKAKRDKKN